MPWRASTSGRRWAVKRFVSAKQQAFDEFHRVLAPGGELSLFEPINRFAFPEPPHLFEGYDVTPVVDLAEKLKKDFSFLKKEMQRLLQPA